MFLLLLGLQRPPLSEGAAVRELLPPQSRLQYLGSSRTEMRPFEVGNMVVYAKPYSILITDDDSACREAMRDIFEPEGYSTFLASSGEEALEIMRESPIHLAL